MPCYMKGTVKIGDLEKLNDIAKKLGMFVEKSGIGYMVYKDKQLISILTPPLNWSVAPEILKQAFREYNKKTIQKAAQKKGWKATIKQSEDKMIIRLTQ